MNAMVQAQGTSMALVPTTMSEAMHLAEFMSKASLIPQHLQGKSGDCLLVVMQAQRWGMDALSVAQCTSVVKGKLCYEGKLVSAVLMSMGVIKDELDYEFSGTGQNRKVVVTGTLARSGNKKSVEGTIAQWKTGNDAWTKDADQMLTYRGARQWARRWAPSAMLGVYTPDEMEDGTDAPMTVRQGDNITSITPRSKSEKSAAESKPAAQGNSQPQQSAEIVDGDFTDRNAHDAEESAGAPSQDAPHWDVSDGPKKVILAKATAVGMDEAAILAKFGTVTQPRVNEILRELTKMAAAG